MLTHRIVDPMTDHILLASGAMLVAGGMALRMAGRRNPAGDGHATRVAAAESLVGLGLGVVTGAPVVIGLAGLLCFARWNGRVSCADPPPSSSRHILYLAGVIAAVVVIQSLKGLVPLQ